MLLVLLIHYLIERNLDYEKKDLKNIYGFLAKDPVVTDHKLVLHLRYQERKFSSNNLGFRVIKKEKVKQILTKGGFGRRQSFEIVTLQSEKEHYISLKDYNKAQKRNLKLLTYIAGIGIIGYYFFKLLQLRWKHDE